MANSYTTVPAVIPGNLTVSGNLLVKGGQLAMGKYPRMYRIQELGNGQFVETVNLDRSALQQDDPSVPSLLRGISPIGQPFQVATQAPGAPGTDFYWIVLSSTALHVAGPELRVGNAPPYARLLSNAYQALVTANLQSDLATRDLTTYSGYGLQIDTQNQNVGYRIINAAGAIYGASAPLCVWSDNTLRTTTGTTVGTSIATKLIAGKTMSPNSALMVTVAGKVSVSAGSIINMYITYGLVSILFYGFPASTSGYFRCTAIIANQNNAAVQNISSETTYNGVVSNPVVTAATQDTTQDANLSVAEFPGNVADSTTIWCIEAHVLNTWGPI